LNVSALWRPTATLLPAFHPAKNKTPIVLV
jgi:hypothetical protein